MVQDRVEKHDHILIVDQQKEDLEQAGEILQRYFPAAAVDTAQSFDEFEESFSSGEFDIVVLDYELSRQASIIELLYRLKTVDYEPSVVVVSKDSPARIVNELYKHGCHRCIEKDDRWLEELGGAVDYLLKWRKAKAENLLLRAKLTEANYLLQQKNRRLDEFSASVAHDIRGPLGGIAMKLEYLVDTYGEGIDERFRTLLGRCLSSTERLTDLVQAMYEYARLGPKAAMMQKVNLTELIEQVLEDMPFDEELKVNVKLDELGEIYGNADLLRRVFVNLVNNAVKYNDKDSVEISFNSLGVQERVLAPFLKFEIRDNGAGIGERDLKDVFSMFVRGGGAEEQAQGMGVGLAVVKRIIELHFGTIEVQSELGCGTAFVITLPMEPVGLCDE